MFVLVVSSLFGLMAAAPSAPASINCCMPNKWSATLLAIGAILPAGSTDPTIEDSSSVMDYDFDLKMTRLQMRQRDQKTGMMQDIDILIDYNNTKTYSLVAGACYVSPQPAPMNAPCAGANSTYMGTHTIGTGANTVTVDSYSMMMAGQVVHMQVQADTCTIVGFALYGDQGDGSKSLNTYILTDVKKDAFSMANPFVMPAACKNAIATPVGK